MASTDMSIQHGEIVFLHELVRSPEPYRRTRERSVRVTGRCVHVDTHQKRLIIQDRSNRLTVNIELIADQLFAIDGLYQFIGELREERGEVVMGGTTDNSCTVLRARVARAVDGLDMSLYEQSVRLRRAFLERHGLGQGK